MQESIYNKIRKLQEKIQQIQTFKQLHYLLKNETMGHIKIDFTHRKPSVLSWDVNKNELSGNYNVLIFPTVTIEDKIYTPNKQFAIEVPEKIKDWETIFIKTIKQAISQVEFQYIRGYQ